VLLLFVSDSNSDLVLVLKRDGSLIESFGSGLRPAGLAWDPGRRSLWTAGEFDRAVSELTAEGVLRRRCDGPREPGVQGLGAVFVVDPDALDCRLP
jgi:hypothetical protein